MDWSQHGLQLTYQRGKQALTLSLPGTRENQSYFHPIGKAVLFRALKNGLALSWFFVGMFVFFLRKQEKGWNQKQTKFQRETICLNRNWTTVSISAVLTGTKDLVEMRLFSISQLPFLVSKWVEQFCKLCLNGSSSVQRRRKTSFIFLRALPLKLVGTEETKLHS